MKRAVRLLFVFCLIFIFCANTVAVQAMSNAKKPPLSLMIDNKVVDSKLAVASSGSNVYVSLRTIGEWLKYSVTWDYKTKTLQLKNSKETIKVTGDKKEFYINGKKYTSNTTALYANTKVYITPDFANKYLNCNAQYDKAKNQIVLSKKSSVSPSKGSAENNLIEISGKKIKEKSIIRSGLLYLPLRAVGESFGYKVDYDAKTKIMQIALNEQTIKIIIGKPEAYINGAKVKLNFTPFLSSEGKAYATMDFIQDSLGCEVKYDSSKFAVYINKKALALPADTDDGEIAAAPAKIQDILYDDRVGFPQISIFADKAISYNSFSLSNPDRLIVDIPNSLVDTSFETKEINQGDILRARIGQFSVEPNVVRVVIDLKSSKNCRLTQSADKKSISLVSANIIQPVVYSKEKNYDVFTIKGTNKIENTVTELENSQKLVLDINDSILEGTEQTISSTAQFVKNVTAKQYEVGTTRIEFDLMPNVYYEIKSEKDQTKIYISNFPFSIVDYNKSYNNAIVNLSPGAKVNCEIAYDEQNNIVKVIAQKELNIEAKRYDVGDNIVEYFEVLKENRGSGIYTITSFKLKPGIKYDKLSDSNNTVKLKFYKKVTSAKDLTIIIDAGHGGKDPGAVSKDGAREKDFTLAYAQKLNEKLTGLGFKTIMTRQEDKYVVLQERSSLANTSYADFFLSIHFNAATTSSAKGIETLYYPNTPSETYSISNKEVASIFHKEILNSVHRSSRGMTPRPLLHVLNKTKMPAILTELGFITNPEELTQIKKSEYKENATSAIAASIVKYFQDIEKYELGIDVASIYSQNTAENIIENTEETSQEIIVTEN